MASYLEFPMDMSNKGGNESNYHYIKFILLKKESIKCLTAMRTLGKPCIFATRSFPSSLNVTILLSGFLLVPRITDNTSRNGKPATRAGIEKTIVFLHYAAGCNIFQKQRTPCSTLRMSRYTVNDAKEWKYQGENGPAEVYEGLAAVLARGKFRHAIIITHAGMRSFSSVMFGLCVCVSAHVTRCINTILIRERNHHLF